MATFESAYQEKSQHLSGRLYDIQTKQFVSGKLVELWYKGNVYDVLIGTGVSNSSGEFCLRLDEKDIDHIKRQSSATDCLPKFFVKVNDQDEYKTSWVQIDGSEDLPSELFSFPEDFHSEQVLLVGYKSTNTPYETVVLSSQLIDVNSGDPIKGGRVKATILVDGQPILDLGERVTGGRGHFTFAAAITPDIAVKTNDPESAVAIEVTLFYEDGDNVQSKVVHVFTERPDFSTVVIEIEPLAVAKESQDIDGLCQELGHPINPELDGFLASNNLRSLRDVRAFGNLDPKSFTADGAKADALWLGKHARFETVSKKAATRERVIEKGYSNFRDVSAVSKGTFVSDFKKDDDSDGSDIEMAAFHRMAGAQKHVLNNILTIARLESRVKLNSDHYQDVLGNGHEPYCNCQDCEAAVSPLAYLADLLKYTTEHIKKDSEFITIDQLEKLFYQPFGDLPADCDEMEKKLCQYRIAIELLRCYLDDLIDQGQNPTDCQNTNLERAQAEYRNSAYFLLLNLLGTSYDELRKADSVAYANRESELKSLTNRLGISFHQNVPILEAVASNNTIRIKGNHVNALLRHTTFIVADSVDNDGEYNLDTGNLPTYDSGNDSTTITVVESVDNITTANPNGRASLDTVSRLFLDVESGENTEEMLETIFGLRNSNRKPLEDQPEPEIVRWQLEFFRELWADQDHISDSYTNRELPIIDPDIIGPDDFRNPTMDPIGTGGFAVSDQAYELWKKRRDWIDVTVIEGVLKNPSNWTPKGVEYGDRYFKVTGNLGDLGVSVGDRFQVSGSLNGVNDGTYTIDFLESAPSSKMYVKEVIPDPTTNSGSLSLLTRHAIVSASSTGNFVCEGDLSSLLADDFITVRGASDNYGTFTVDSNVITSNPSTVDVQEPVLDTGAGGLVEIEQSFAFEITVSGDIISVRGTDDDEANLNGSATLELTGAGQNDGTYNIDGAIEHPDDSRFVKVTLENSTPLSSKNQEGKLSYKKQLTITGVGLGARKFTVGGVNISSFIDNADPVKVVGSSGNDAPSYTANGDAQFVDGKSEIVVNEAIPSPEANGSVRLEYNIDAVSGNDITINGIDLSGIISNQDLIVINQATGGEVSYTVDSVSFSTNTVITLQNLSGDAAVNDDLYLFYAITEVDISNKYFTLDQNQLDQVFAGDEIEIVSSTGNNGTYKVEQVSFDAGATPNPLTLVFVQQAILSDTVDGSLQLSRTLRLSSSKPNVDALYTAMQGGAAALETPWDNTYDSANFSTVAKELRAGVNVETHTADIDTKLNLTIDAFLEMVRIANKDADFESGLSSDVVTDSEWDDFLNILVSSVKKNKYSDWINGTNEEVDLGIELNSDVFWISKREPKDGEWPIEHVAGVPLIDPELVSYSDLPEGLAGSDAADFYAARQTEISEVMQILSSSELSIHSQEIINFVFGVLMEIDDPVHSLWQLRNDLNSIEAADVDVAKRVIEEDLLLSVEDFTILMDVFSRMDQQGYTPNDEDREFYIPLLVTTYKKRRLYPIWANEELAQLTTGTPPDTVFEYYRLRKSALPKWRATSMQRAEWQRVLERRSEIPVVDPDRVFAEDFKTYTSGEPGYEAYSLWVARRTELDSLKTDIEDIATGTNELTDLQNQIVAVLALESFDQYQEIIDLEQDGINVKSRLEQLGLTTVAYRRLNELLELAPTGINGLLESEKEEAVNILINVIKRRKYATWTTEEATAGVTLSQDFFKENKDEFLSYSIVQDKLVKYRATYKERRNWQRELSGRIENVNSAALSLHDVVRKTEEETLPYLRDALIQTVGDNDLFLEENAKILSDRFLFDFKVNCCQEVTRVSQAIETLQQILWTERTGVAEQSGLGLSLHANDFEEEWKWIGSYSTWRSAMFVFLFPENLLYPTLRRHQSPGFIKLSKNLRGNKRITPETACYEAHQYAEYLKDVCNLKVQATCTAETVINSGDCNDGFTEEIACRYYVFAKADTSNKAYFSVGKSMDWSVEGQGFWTEIEAFGERLIKIIGAVPWKHYQTTGNRYIYVFGIVREDDGSRVLAYARFNLDSSRWEEDEYEVLNLPETVGELNDWDIIIQQGNNDLLPPRFIVKRAHENPDGIILTAFNELTVNNEWQYEEWPYDARVRPYGVVIKGHMSESRLCSQHILNGTWWEDTVTFVQRLGKIYLATSLDSSPFSYELDLGTTSQVEFIGSSTYAVDPQTSEPTFNTAGVTLFYKIVDSGEVKQVRIELGSLPSGSLAHAFINTVTSENLNPGLFADMEYLAPNWGIASGGASLKNEPFLHAFQAKQSSGGGIMRFSMLHTVNSQPLVLQPNPFTLLPITPKFSGPFGLVQNLDGNALQVHKGLVELAVLNNTGFPALRSEYISEFFYFMPIYVGLQLQQRGHYTEALDWYRTVYDFRQADVSKRKIYHGLTLEESIEGGYLLSPNWLQDPLNPHGVALTRANTYTRYTLLTIIRCLEDYADAEFTIDTAETVPRARELYKEAIELLQLPELALLEDECHCGSKTDEIIKRIACELTPEELAEWRWTIELMEDQLQRIQGCGFSELTVDGIVDAILDEGVPNLEDRISNAQKYLEDQVEAYEQLTDDTVGDAIEQDYLQADKMHDVLMADPAVENANTAVGASVGNDYVNSLVHLTGIPPEMESDGKYYDFLLVDTDTGELPEGFSVQHQLLAPLRWLNPESPTIMGNMNLVGGMFPNIILNMLLTYPEGVYVPILSNYFCVPDNPVIRGLRMRAELNLFKIRNCMNIAGMTRSLDPYAAPTDTTSGVPVIGPGGQLSLPGSARISPTPYRYQVIVDRAKQLVTYAQQIEANFLAALEKRDAEYYNRMKAKQDLSMSKASVKLQKLRVKVSEGEVDLAELQRDRATLQVQELQEMIDDGLLADEQRLVDMYIAKGVLDAISSVLSAQLDGFQANIYSMIPAIAASTIKASLDVASIGLQTSINVTQIYASQARREQEWGYQQNLARHDVKIGNQSIKVAQSRLRVSGQEHAISELQQDHAEATLDFLTTKFTNVELYDFMSETLEGVYSYFLQQATATAKLAMNQLAFERQELPPAFIVDDYWQVPTDGDAVATVGSNAPDRRGLTGSARLLQDITKLDQFAFDTDKRKLQMSKTFSLSNLAPIEFQQFKDSGVITFQTMMEYFDRDFPGHYLRLIKKVKVDVIALTPPTDGIKATLTSSGTSRVTIGGDLFQTIVARREPEMIALTGTRNATGMFEMQAENQFLNPFEGSGVDMLWEFKLRKEANLFNYHTIADVLITIDYTAFHDYNYQQQVIRQLPPFHSADRPFSFRSELADQFYELGHPETELPGENPEVEFKLTRGYFPPNIVDIRIADFKMLFVTPGGQPNGMSEGDRLVKFEFFEYSEEGVPQAPVPGEGVINADTNLISSNGAGGFAIVRNKTPFGVWKLKVSSELSRKIKDEEILDIMMVFTYTGDYPTSIN